MENPKEYWLSAPKGEVGKLLVEKIRQYQRYLQTSGRLFQLRELYSSYHGFANDRSSDTLTAAGDQGELTKAKVNLQRSLLQNLLTMVTGERPAAFCRAANNDSASTEEAMLGNSILEDYMKQRGLDTQLRYTVETALAIRKGFFVIDWDFHTGDEIAVEEKVSKGGVPYQNVLRQGDAVFAVKNLTEVAFDPNLSTFEKMPWIAVESLVNKWDLAARFKNDEEMQAKIVSMDTNWAQRSMYQLVVDPALLSFPSDMIPIWRLYASKSSALEDGRFVTILEDGTELFDDPLPFDEIPAAECDPSPELTKRFGYTPASDGLGLQDALDGSVSAIITNILATGGNTIWSKPGQNVDYQELADGLKHLQSEVKPEVVNLNTLPPQLIQVVELLKSLHEQVYNLNSTARGVPPSANMSGASMALLQSIAIKLSSGIQASYVSLIERVCNLLLQMLKKFANTERVLDVGGVGNRYVVKRWSKNDITQIRRVVVEVGSPLAQTVSGRLEIARDLLKQGLIKTATDYFSVLATGRLDSATSPIEKMIALVAAEDEMIARGEVPVVLPTDDPVFHLQHHIASVADPDARKDPKVVAAYREHVMAHLEDARTMDPLLASLLKFDLPPQLIGQPGAPAPTPAAGGAAPQVTDERSAVQKAADAVKEPRMPINPISGERWNPENGGVPNAA